MTCCASTPLPYGDFPLVASSDGTVALSVVGACPGAEIVVLQSEAEGEFVECDADPVTDRHVGGHCVVAAAEVLHEGVPSCDRVQ
jgi:hypothetical protein